MKNRIRGILNIVLMMLSCFIPMSCMTVESYKGSHFDEEQFSVDKIKSIHLNSGEKIVVDDTQIRLLKMTNDSVYAFLINAYDTTWSADKKSFKVNTSLDTIRLHDVREILVNAPDRPLTFQKQYRSQSGDF